MFRNTVIHPHAFCQFLHTLSEATLLHHQRPAWAVGFLFTFMCDLVSRNCLQPQRPITNRKAGFVTGVHDCYLHPLSLVLTLGSGQH